MSNVLQTGPAPRAIATYSSFGLVIADRGAYGGQSTIRWAPGNLVHRDVAKLQLERHLSRDRACRGLRSGKEAHRGPKVHPYRLLEHRARIDHNLQNISVAVTTKSLSMIQL